LRSTESARPSPREHGRINTMSDPHSPSDRARALRRQAAATPPVPPVPSQRFRYWPAVVLVALVAIAVAAYLISRPEPTPNEPASAELDLCRRFMALKNAHDPVANDLLGPAPVVPAEAVSPEEAARLHAEFFLRDNFRIADVRPETSTASGPDARFV